MTRTADIARGAPKRVQTLLINHRRLLKTTPLPMRQGHSMVGHAPALHTLEVTGDERGGDGRSRSPTSVVGIDRTSKRITGGFSLLEFHVWLLRGCGSGFSRVLSYTVRGARNGYPVCVFRQRGAELVSLHPTTRATPALCPCVRLEVPNMMSIV